MSQTTRPVLGYLTKPWTPPASCFSLMLNPPEAAVSWAWQGATCKTNSYVSDSPECWPPRTPGAPEAPNLDYLSGWGFYSPGILCPIGYTTACSATYGQPVSGWSLQFPPTIGETAVGCCPSGGYTCSYFPAKSDGSETYGLLQTCQLLVTSTTVEVARCGEPTPSSVVVPYASSITTGSVTTTSIRSTFTGHGPLIQINWRVEDLTTTTPTSSGFAPTSTNTDSEGNISGGAIAGIVIGAVFGLGGIAIGIFWYMRKVRTRDTNTGDQSKDPHCAPGQQELQSVTSQQETPQPVELLTIESAQEAPVHEGTDNLLRSEMQG